MAELVLGGLAGSLLYNRENFMFDRKLQLKREFQGQGMRIKQFALYREDIRDLMGLTVSKMDNYLIVSTLQLGLCITILTEGRPRTNESPPWLLWLYAITIMGAFLYFLMCAWLAMHASIAAHSFGVRMLTQFVRLPVPSAKQMDAARAFATDFEGSQMRNIFRIPVVKQQMRRLNEAMDNLTIQEAAAQRDAPSEAGGHPESERSDELPTRATSAAVLRQHTRLYRELQANWQAYDAYARVCMALGTNQLLNALGYDLLQLLIIFEHEPFSALSCGLVCAVAAWLLARLDLWLSPRLLALAAVLLVVPPVLAMISLTIDEEHSPHALVALAKFLVLIVFLIHIVWITFMVYIAKADHFGSLSLPKNFRSVLYLDVFGQMAEESEEEPGEAAVAGEERTQGAGPGPGVAGAVGLREEALLPTVEEHGMPLSRQWSYASTTSACGMQRQLSLSRTNLRTSLANLCWRLRAEFERELLHWEDPTLTEVLGDDLPELSDVAQLRTRLDSVTAQLRELAPDLAMEPLESSRSTRDEGAETKVWLKLEWNPSGQATEYFYCFDTGKHAFIRPREPDRVLELEALDQQLKALEGKAQALSELPLQPEEPPETAPARAPASRPLQPVPASPPSSQPSSVAVASKASPTSAPPSPQQATQQPLDPETEDDGPAQETQFGGREAVPYAAAVADQNFHPHQPGTHEDARRQRRPPGQLPWHTFLKGSLVLIFVYVIGVLWYVSTIFFGIDIPVDPPEPLPDPGIALLSTGPHRFFNPIGIVCDDASKSVLVAERFAVHELSLEAAASLPRNLSGSKLVQEESGPKLAQEENLFRPALVECLAQAPDFHAAGIRSIALDCTEQGAVVATRCSVLLLGARGHEALRCSVGQDQGQSRTPQRVAVHGGEWEAFVASSSGEALWARRGHDGALVLMQERGGALLPHAEAKLDGAGRSAQLQLLGVRSELLLGLEPQGALRAWPLVGSELVWSTQLGAGVRWLDLCVAGEAAYLLGVPASAGGQRATAALWRLALPLELRQLAAAA